MENVAFNRDHVTNTHASRQKYFDMTEDHIALGTER